MKCPKCEREMIRFNKGILSSWPTMEKCNNRDCWFYGIERYME